MTKKESFIKLVEETIFSKPDIYAENDPDLYDAASAYFEALKGGKDKEKPLFTENGKLILGFIQENKDTYNNLFKAKDIGEGLGITSRTVSGSIRKLVTDGFVEKMGENPISYSLTEKGKNINLSEI